MNPDPYCSECAKVTGGCPLHSSGTYAVLNDGTLVLVGPAVVYVPLPPDVPGWTPGVPRWTPGVPR